MTLVRFAASGFSPSYRGASQATGGRERCILFLLEGRLRTGFVLSVRLRYLVVVLVVSVRRCLALSSSDRGA